MAQVSESDYKIAKESKDPSIRQEFLNAIDFGNNSYLVKRRKYFHKRRGDKDYICSREDFEVTMQFNYSVNPKKFDLNSSRFEIFSSAFEEYTFTDFMNTLLYHEVHHARQFNQEHIRRFDSYLDKRSKSFQEYGDILTEIPAFLNQLMAKDFPPSSEELVNLHIDILFPLDRFMRKRAKFFGRDWKKDISGVLCPSPHDDVVREVYDL